MAIEVEENEAWEVPAPKVGGAFYYCQHDTVEVVKVPKKRAKTVHHLCKFRTRNIRRYRRHYIRRHAERPVPAPVVYSAPPPKEYKPKYLPGDCRRDK